MTTYTFGQFSIDADTNIVTSLLTGRTARIKQGVEFLESYLVEAGEITIEGHLARTRLHRMLDRFEYLHTHPTRPVGFGKK